MTNNSSGTGITNNSVVYQDVSKYEEAGFRVQFFFSGANPFSSIIGDYYGVGNDVIHGHWATGDYGTLTQIKITKIDGSSFDMNYFVLTSNTETGGGAASGNEKAYIHASGDGTSDDYSQLLPAENWGFPATQVFLGSQFDSVKAVWFDVANAVDCFGMDNFFIDQAAPGTVPEPGSLALAAFALFGMTAAARRRNR
ncbi:PEP-CTERM sorting domain-containing protein [Roseateles sp. NT4]